MVRSVAAQWAKVKDDDFVSPKKGNSKGVIIKKPVLTSGEKKEKRHKALRDQVLISKLTGLQKSLEYPLRELVPVGKPPHPKEKEKYV